MHEWLDDIGLKMGDVWEWYDMPVLFTAHSMFGRRDHQWLVVWLADYGNNIHTWMLAWLSPERYAALRDRRIDLRSVFADPEDDEGELLIVRTYAGYDTMKIYLPATLFVGSFPKAGEYLPERLSMDGFQLRCKYRDIHAVYKKDGEWVVAWFEELPEVQSQGRTKEEARDGLLSALENMYPDALAWVGIIT